MSLQRLAVPSSSSRAMLANGADKAHTHAQCWNWPASRFHNSLEMVSIPLQLRVEALPEPQSVPPSGQDPPASRSCMASALSCSTMQPRQAGLTTLPCVSPPTLQIQNLEIPKGTLLESSRSLLQRPISLRNHLGPSNLNSRSKFLGVG